MKIHGFLIDMKKAMHWKQCNKGKGSSWTSLMPNLTNILKPFLLQYCMLKEENRYVQLLPFLSAFKKEIFHKPKFKTLWLQDTGKNWSEKSLKHFSIYWEIQHNAHSDRKIFLHFFANTLCRKNEVRKSFPHIFSFLWGWKR